MSWPPTTQQRLGRKIKCARVQAGMTQTELAKAVFVTQPVISDYENGICEPKWSVVLAISSALNQPIEYFLITQNNGS